MSTPTNPTNPTGPETPLLRPNTWEDLTPDILDDLTTDELADLLAWVFDRGLKLGAIHPGGYTMPGTPYQPHENPYRRPTPEPERPKRWWHRLLGTR